MSAEGTHNFALRVPVPLMRRLVDTAKFHRRSFNNEILVAIERHVERTEDGAAKAKGSST